MGFATSRTRPQATFIIIKCSCVQKRTASGLNAPIGIHCLTVLSARLELAATLCVKFVAFVKTGRMIFQAMILNSSTPITVLVLPLHCPA